LQLVGRLMLEGSRKAPRPAVSAPDPSAEATQHRGGVSVMVGSLTSAFPVSGG